MSATTNSSPTPERPALPLSKVLSAIASPRRWRILRELAKSGPLPVCEIAKRLRATESGISKHFAVLRESGIVYNNYGLYAIDRRFLVPGEHSLDLGHVVIRLDMKG